MTTITQQNFFGTTELQLKEIFEDWGVATYRINQVFTWVYHYHCRDFDEMTNLSKSLRSQLKERFYFRLPKIQSRTHSKDGSIKYLLELDDVPFVDNFCILLLHRHVFSEGVHANEHTVS